MVTLLGAGRKPIFPHRPAAAPLPVAAYLVAAGVAISAVITAAIRPHWFGGFLPGGMNVGFQIGQVIGKILLTVSFFMIVTPMGVPLHLLGKDLPRLRIKPELTTYWQKAKSSREFDRMF